MAVGFNPYQLAQLYSQPQKEMQSQEIKEKSTASFEKQYKNKMNDELQAILAKLQADANRRKKKNKGLRKFLDVVSIFDPTGLVSGTSKYLGAKDMKEGLKLMNANPQLKQKYKNSFLSKGLKSYDEDVTKSWRDINTGEAFAKGAIMDFAGKKIGADGGSNRMKFSDFGDVASSFKAGFDKNKVGDNIIDLSDDKGLLSNIIAGVKNTGVNPETLTGSIKSGGGYKGSSLDNLLSQYKGSKATKEGEKQLMMLLNQLSSPGFSMSGDYTDYFSQ